MVVSNFALFIFVVWNGFSFFNINIYFEAKIKTIFKEKNGNDVRRKEKEERRQFKSLKIYAKPKHLQIEIHTHANVMWDERKA